MLNRPQYNMNITIICTGTQKTSLGSLYCDICFILVGWNQTHDISELCLHLHIVCILFAYFLI